MHENVNMQKCVQNGLCQTGGLFFTLDIPRQFRKQRRANQISTATIVTKQCTFIYSLTHASEKQIKLSNGAILHDQDTAGSGTH